jgi:hypothetical protein
MSDRATAQVFGIVVCLASLGVVFWRAKLARAHRHVRQLGVLTGLGVGLVVVAVSIVAAPGVWAAIYRFSIGRYAGG